MMLIMDHHGHDHRRAGSDSPLSANSDGGSSMAIDDEHHSSATTTGTGSLNSSNTSEFLRTTKKVRSSEATIVTPLKFSIENILQPEFGMKCLSPSSAAAAAASFPFFNWAAAAGLVECSSSTGATATEDAIAEYARDGRGDTFPSWIYCTRYSDRPSSGPRTRKLKRKAAAESQQQLADDEKRPRTAFTTEQLERLKSEFMSSRYLNEKQRQGLAYELGLNESQIKIWFQNKRAKLKKSVHQRLPPPPIVPVSATVNSSPQQPLTLQLFAQHHGIVAMMPSLFSHHQQDM